MTNLTEALATKTEAELLLISEHPEAHSPDLVAAAQQELQVRRDAALSSYAAAPSSRQGPVLLGGALLGLLGLGIWYQRQAAPPVAPPRPAAAPGALKLETAVATPLPQFDVESPILRQLALLPPAERAAAGPTMAQYQRLTRRFWLAQDATEYLVKQAQTGHPNLPVFAQQLATVQGHWRVLREALGRGDQFPPVMTDHLTRMKQVASHQQAALGELQADCASQHPPRLAAAPTLAAQQQVKQLLAPLRREPGPLTVHLR